MIADSMKLSITESYETFDYWLSKSYIDEELRKTLSNATILIVPFENLYDSPQPLFPIGTDRILQFFQQSLKQSEQGERVDICISDNEFRSFEFNCRYRNLGKFVVVSIAIPVFINILSSYVYDYFIAPNERVPQVELTEQSNVQAHDTLVGLTDNHYSAPPNIKVSVTVVAKDGSAENISYDGPAAEFDNVLKALENYEESE